MGLISKISIIVGSLLIVSGWLIPLIRKNYYKRKFKRINYKMGALYLLYLASHIEEIPEETTGSFAKFVDQMGKGKKNVIALGDYCYRSKKQLPEIFKMQIDYYQNNLQKI